MFAVSGGIPFVRKHLLTANFEQTALSPGIKRLFPCDPPLPLFSPSPSAIFFYQLTAGCVKIRIRKRTVRGRFA